MTGANERQGAPEVAPTEAAQAGHQVPASPAAPSRSDWLAWRRRGIGASDVAMLLGLSPWGGPWELWMQKLHGWEQPDRPELAMGRAIEPLVLAWAAEQLDGTLLEGGRLEGRGPLRGSPDGFVRLTGHVTLDGPGDLVGLEAKTARYPGGEWGEAWTDQIPAHYRVQCRAYLALSGLPSWVLAVWFLGNYERRIYVVQADPVEQARIREVATTWWQRHVIEGEPPEVDGSDAARDWLGEARPKGRGLRAATDAEEQVARTLADVDERIGELDQERAALRNWLRSAIGGADGLYFTGGRVSWSRKSNRLTVEIR